MEHLILDPLFDRAMLDKIAVRSRREGYGDVSGTVRWLLRQGSRDRMLNDIKTAWAKSSLPLAGWSPSIQAVDACTTKDRTSLWLEVRIGGTVPRAVIQMAPFDLSELELCEARLPHTLPSIAREIALAAPGLELAEVGELLPPHYLLNPMAEMREWVAQRRITPQVCEEYHCVYPDPDTFLMEVVNNGQGCCYVLHRSGHVYFHEYGDLPGLIPCTATFEDLVQAYFRSPESILEPYTHGWASYPNA